MVKRKRSWLTDRRSKLLTLLFQHPHDGIGFRQIVKETGWSPPTVSSKLKDFDGRGWLTRDPSSGKYKLIGLGNRVNLIQQLVLPFLIDGTGVSQFTAAVLCEKEAEGAVRLAYPEIFSDVTFQKWAQPLAIGLSILELYYRRQWRKQAIRNLSDKARNDLARLDKALDDFIDVVLRENEPKIRSTDFDSFDRIAELLEDEIEKEVLRKEILEFGPSHVRFKNESIRKAALKYEKTLSTRKLREMYLGTLRVPKLMLVFPVSGFEDKGHHGDMEPYETAWSMKWMKTEPAISPELIESAMTELEIDDWNEDEKPEWKY
jgi:hypothetical protein